MTTTDPVTAERGTDYNTRNRDLRLRYKSVADELATVPESDPRYAQLVAEACTIGNEFAGANMRLARHTANTFTRHGRAWTEDILSAAFESLWKAFLNWDPDRGTFSTFARMHLEGDVRREVNATEFGGSYHDWTARAKVLAAARALESELGRTPSHLEVADRAGVPLSQVQRVRRQSTLSLDLTLGEGGGTLADTIAAPGGVGDLVSTLQAASELDHVAWLKLFRERTASLSATEKYVLFRRSGLDGGNEETIAEIAATLGMNRELVRRAHRALTDGGVESVAADVIT